MNLYIKYSLLQKDISLVIIYSNGLDEQENTQEVSSSEKSVESNCGSHQKIEDKIRIELKRITCEIEKEARFEVYNFCFVKHFLAFNLNY